MTTNDREPASIVGEFIDDAALIHSTRSIGTVASYRVAQDLLADPDAQTAIAANLPTDVLLAALVDRGALKRDVDDGWVWYEGDHELGESA